MSLKCLSFGIFFRMEGILLWQMIIVNWGAAQLVHKK